MQYIVCQYNVVTRTPMMIFMSKDLNETRNFINHHVNTLMNIINENVPENDRVKVTYEDYNKKLVVFKNKKELKPGYFYNSEVLSKTDLYYYTITFISQKSRRLIRIPPNISFVQNNEVNEFTRINTQDGANLHKQVMNELLKQFSGDNNN